jgi:hypothetical protein
MAFFGQFIHFCVYAQHKMPPGAQKSPNHKQVSAGFSGFNLRILILEIHPFLAHLARTLLVL